MCIIFVCGITTLLQDYVAETKSFVSEGKDSMSFLLAQSYLTTGEIEKATRCFLSSVSYPGKTCNPIADFS